MYLDGNTLYLPLKFSGFFLGFFFFKCTAIHLKFGGAQANFQSENAAQRQIGWEPPRHVPVKKAFYVDGSSYF